MIKSLSIMFIISCGALCAAPQRETIAIQEMKLALEQLTYQLNAHQSEIDLFQERVQKMERSTEQFAGQLKEGVKDRTLENRLARLEKANETLIADFKELKGHLNESQTGIATCQTKLTQIDKQLNADIQSLKQSLQTMLALLQKGGGDSSGKSYIVKPGDSLGHIALEHKTDARRIKEKNNLSSDKIYVGQKLLLP